MRIYLHKRKVAHSMLSDELRHKPANKTQARAEQDARNAEYYARLASGEIREEPMPRLVNNQVTVAAPRYSGFSW